ncbi:energy transducer TonB [Roseateles sp.]|uniref:energy transducer TonB n=1 Tax=Roseateles sp. TaxID=1971397 RepID=UPI0032647795
MDFAQRQPAPGRRVTGFGVVLVLHLLLVWAMLSSLAHHVIQAVQQQPIEIKLVKPETPPPAPKATLLPLPSMVPPPLPFIPPPEVLVTQPPETTIPATSIPQPSLGVGTETAAPQQGRGQAGSGLARTPPQLDFSKCGTPAYPDINVQGTAMIVFTMTTTGAINEVHVAESSGPSRKHKLLDRLAVEFVLSCKGTPGTVNGNPVPLRGITPISWRLKD